MTSPPERFETDQGPDNEDHKFDWIIQEDLASWIKMSRLDKGTQVYAPDEPLDTFYLLRNGLLGIFKQIPPNKSILVGKVRPGQTIGVTQLMLNSTFPAHVRTIKGSIALKGNREDFEKIKTRYPDELTEVLLEESVHYSSMYQRIQTVLSENLEQKIARELLDLADEIGRDTKKGLELVVGITRKEISNMIGCTHESVSRVMSKWEKEGTIETNHKNITLKNVEKLRSDLTRMT